MYDCFGTGFSDGKLILVMVVIYTFIIGAPIAITYISSGMGQLFQKQLKLASVSVVILITGGYLVFSPKLSYVVAIVTFFNWALAVYAIINRNKLEPNL